MNLTIIAYLAAAATVFGGGFGTAWNIQKLTITQMELNPWHWIKRMKLCFCSKICSVSKPLRLEAAKLNLFSVCPYMSSPTTKRTIRRLNPNQSGRTIFSYCSILSIFRMRCFSQVGYPIVRPKPVNVVDAINRKPAIHIEPCESMALVPVPGYSHCEIPRTVRASNSVANFYPVRCLSFLSEYTSFRVVIKKFAQSLCAKIGSSHAVVPYKQWVGERPSRVSSTSRLRHFTGLHVGRPV